MIALLVAIGLIAGWLLFGFLQRRRVDREIDRTALSQKKLEVLFGPRKWKDER